MPHNATWRKGKNDFYRAGLLDGRWQGVSRRCVTCLLVYKPLTLALQAYQGVRYVRCKLSYTYMHQQVRSAVIHGAIASPVSPCNSDELTSLSISLFSVTHLNPPGNSLGPSGRPNFPTLQYPRRRRARRCRMWGSRCRTRLNGNRL